MKTANGQTIKYRLRANEIGGDMELDWLRELRIDVDRLEYFENLHDESKVEEYKNMIVNHVKEMLKESEG